MSSYLKDGEKYDPKKHAINEHVHMAISTLCSLWESDSIPLARSHYEHWYTVNLLGSVFDFALRDPVLHIDVKR